jgi:hypothetical protein
MIFQLSASFSPAERENPPDRALSLIVSTVQQDPTRKFLDR